MLQDIITGVTAYISTSLDYLIILMVIFSTVKAGQKHLVYWGDLLGTAILVSSSLVMAFILKFAPQEWVLGLLGLIPIYMGIKLLVKGETDDDDAVTNGLKNQSSVILGVAMITVATCGADNIGVYVPLFASLTTTSIITVLIAFLVMLSLFCYIGAQLGRLPKVTHILDEYGRYITAAVYILIGLWILWESGTITHYLH